MKYGRIKTRPTANGGLEFGGRDEFGQVISLKRARLEFVRHRHRWLTAELCEVNRMPPTWARAARELEIEAELRDNLRALESTARMPD